MLEGIIVKAINEVYTARQDGTELTSCCLEEAFNDDTMEKVTALDEKVKSLQVELIGYKADSNEAHKLGLEIIALREERDKLLAETALQKQRLKEIEEMAKVFDGLSGPLQPTMNPMSASLSAESTSMMTRSRSHSKTVRKST